MTTPPPPPPDPPDWPSTSPSQPSSPRQPAQPDAPSQSWPPSRPQAATGGGRQKWWTGGRIVAAIVIVLVLMGASAAAGFVAGSTWGTIEMFGEGFADGLDVPGVVPVDGPADQGEVLRPGARVAGVVGDRPVAHPMTVESSRTVRLEITDAEFDTVLVLLDSNDEVVDSDDDGGEDTLSALEVTVPAGTYRVRVQPWASGDGGSYTLAVD